VSPLFHGSDNPHICGIAKRKRETEWEVIRIKATPAAFVGTVQASPSPTRSLAEDYQGPERGTDRR
jgi:hypothetical protein